MTTTPTHPNGTLSTVEDHDQPPKGNEMATETHTEKCDPNQDYKLMKLRHVRVETDLWVQACVKAKSEGLTISAVVRSLILEYVQRP